jgi:hypothetical protein
VLASVVPYAADLIALRFVPSRFFGVFMSVHPVLAALVGVVLLGQLLHLHEWLGIVVVVATDAAAVVPARRMTATHTGETPHRACPPRSVPRPRPDVRRPYTGARAGRRVRPGTSSVEAATTSRSRVTSGPT